jgi:hypothetical chaperone protein
LEKPKLDALIDLVDHDLGYRLYRAIEAAKCALSAATATRFSFSEAAVDIEQNVERSAFESWIEPELGQIRNCVDRLLDRCHVTAGDVDAVFMTGGSSFVPAVKSIFEAKFAAARIRAGQEFTSVAEGLAIHALTLENGF